MASHCFQPVPVCLTILDRLPQPDLHFENSPFIKFLKIVHGVCYLFPTVTTTDITLKMVCLMNVGYIFLQSRCFLINIKYLNLFWNRAGQSGTVGKAKRGRRPGYLPSHGNFTLYSRVGCLYLLPVNLILTQKPAFQYSISYMFNTSSSRIPDFLHLKYQKYCGVLYLGC